MFLLNPRETADEWDKDLTLALKSKLAKYHVESIDVEKESPMGDVFLRFPDLDAAKTAQKAFDGRFFATRQIACYFLPNSVYIQKFPLKKY